MKTLKINETAEHWLEPIREKLTTARAAHDEWRAIEDRIAQSREKIESLTADENKITIDLDLEPAFAGKKLMEVRSTREILEKRIPILQDISKRHFAFFRDAVRWLLGNYRYLAPASEIYRRRRERVFNQIKADLKINLTCQQINERTQPIPEGCRIHCRREMLFTNADHLTDPEECVQLLTELESVLPHIEQLVSSEAELLADRNLDEEVKEPEPKIDPRQYIPSKTVAAAKENIWVAKTDLHVADIRPTGGDHNFKAGEQILRLSKNQLELLIKNGHAITLAEFERRRALKGAHSQWQDAQVQKPRDIFAGVEALARS